MKIDILKHILVNVKKSITFWMWKVEKKFFSKILDNFIEYKTPVLSQLWNWLKEWNKVLRKYYSNHLWKEEWLNLPDKVVKIMIKFIWKIDKEKDFFCFDTVDSNKNSAKRMEWLKIVRDWSRWTFWNGYVWHWVSIKSIPLFLDREWIIEKKEEKSTLKFDIFEKQLTKILSTFWNWYWVLADRWYEDKAKFNLLIKLNFNFVIRLKKNRNVLILEWKNKWEIISVWTLEEWNYTVKVDWVEDNLYIFVKKLKWQINPIRVISNINDTKNVLKYLKRWEIERIFKTLKQEYNFEKIWTMKIQKTDNLVALIQLSFWISAYIFNELEAKELKNDTKSESISCEKILKKIKPFLKKKDLTLNRNSITNFLWYYMKFIKKVKFNLKATKKVIFNWQLSLNF